MNIKMLEQMNQEEQRSFIMAISKDTKLFAQTVMGHICKDIPPFHEDIYQILDAQTRREFFYSAFVLFRGSGKSTISKTIKVTHDAMFGLEPFELLLSESIDQASKDLVGIQDEFENNDLIKFIAGELKGSIWNQEQCELANGVYLMTKGYGSRIRGIKWKTQRPSVVCADDFESESNTGTKKQRGDVEQWIDAQVLPTGDPNTIFQFFGTIVHPESFLAKLKDLAYFNPPRGKYYKCAIEEKGQPVWSQRFPKAWTEEKRKFYMERNRLGYFLQEYYLIPAMTGSPSFDLKRIQDLGMTVSFDRFDYLTYLKWGTKKVPLNVFIGVDPARSTKETADDTSIYVIGVTPESKIILLECFTGKIPPNQQVKKIFELVEKYRPRHVEIEVNAYQFALADWCRTRMKEGWQPYFPIHEYNARQGKGEKYIMGLEPYINHGNMSRLSTMKGWDKFYLEASRFDGEKKNNNDNTLDALFLALNNSYPPTKYNVEEEVERRKFGDKKSKKRPLDWMTI